MERYICNLLYEYSESNFITIFKQALNTLGFEVKYMRVLFDEFEKPLDDIPFDKEQLLRIVKRKPNNITLKQQLYDEKNRENNNWFKFGLNVESPFGLNTCSLEWSNTCLDFLLKEKAIETFLEIPNLIYCFCYNQYDCLNQTDERIQTFIKNYPGQQCQVVKNQTGDDVVDVSEHWGRYISTRGITFMAAPLMWFGKEYFKIIPKESLLKFTGAHAIDDGDIIYVKLFDLYAAPTNHKNRERQKDFWQAFNLQKKAEQYEKDRPFDFITWYKERVALKKKKRR